MLKKAQAAEAVETPQPRSGLSISKIVTEFIPVRPGADGQKTFGQIIDETIDEALVHGDRVTGLEINILEEDWAMWQYNRRA